MAQFQTFSLRRYKIDGQEIGFTPSDGLLHIAGEDWTVSKWLKTVERVRVALEKTGMVEKPPPPEVAPWHGKPTSDFLSQNFDDIHKRQRGRIKSAPLLLRLFYDGVITKEHLDADS